MVSTGRGMDRLKQEMTGQASPGMQVPARLEPAKVIKVVPGGASDGNAAVTVRWRGKEFEAPYPSHYFPGVGHSVILAVQGRKPFILCHLIGTP